MTGPGYPEAGAADNRSIRIFVFWIVHRLAAIGTEAELPTKSYLSVYAVAVYVSNSSNANQWRVAVDTRSVVLYYNRTVLNRELLGLSALQRNIEVPGKGKVMPGSSETLFLGEINIIPSTLEMRAAVSPMFCARKRTLTGLSCGKSRSGTSNA